MAPTDRPVFFERNRVYRLYRGGRLFHDFFGDPAEDGFFPEEWIASTVKALNKESRGEHEGISVLQGSGELFSEYLEAHRRELLGGRPAFEVLVKILDSAIRLPVQTHPSKEFARRHLGSPHGKAEMWVVLATRPNASILFGLKEGVTARDLRDAAAASETDRTALPSLLNQFAVAPGDVYFIPARVAHAIGAGCLILEVQEPTDFTIQPESWCGDYHLNEYEKYLGLDPATAFGCFDVEDLVGARAVAAGRKLPRSFPAGPGVEAEHLLTESDTTDFGVNRYRIAGGSAPLGAGPGVYVVTAGEGTIEGPWGARPLRRGDYFFLPASASQPVFATRSGLEIVECLPPRVS